MNTRKEMGIQRERGIILNRKNGNVKYYERIRQGKDNNSITEQKNE